MNEEEILSLIKKGKLSSKEGINILDNQRDKLIIEEIKKGLI